MDIQNMLLTSGMIIVCIFAMKFSHDSVIAVEKMTEEIQIMFVKS